MADIRRTKLPVYKQTVSTSKTSTGTKKAKQTQPKTVTKTTVTKKPTATVKKAIVPATQIKKPIEKKEQIATELTQFAKEVKTAKTPQKTTQKPASNTQKQIKMTSMKGDKVTMKPRTNKTSTGTKKAKQTQSKTVTKTTVTKKPTTTVKKSKTETAIQNITKIAKEQKPIVKLDSLADYRKAERLNTQFYENVKKGTEALQKAKKTTQKKTSTEKIKNIADVMRQDREDVSLTTHYDNTKELAKKLDDFEKSVVIQKNANAYKSAKSAEQKNKLQNRD